MPATGAATAPEIPVEFLSIADARKAIVDESIEPYFKLLQPLEMTVKTGRPITGDTLDQQRDECRRRYQAGVEAFTADEKQALTWCVARLVPLVAEDYPLLAATPWSFLKLSPRLEGALPHTRGRQIVLSNAILGPLVQMKKDKAPEWLLLARFGEVLLHEQMHVVQRQHPERFVRLYERYWGFKHAREVNGCPWLTEHQIVNPDGVDVRRVFPIGTGDQTRWIWPLVVLNPRDEGRASFADLRKVAIDLEPEGDGGFRVKVDTDGKPVMRDLMQVPQYDHLFRPTREIFHPNEAAADLLARSVTAQKVLPGHAPPEAQPAVENVNKMLAPLRKAFGEALAAQE